MARKSGFIRRNNRMIRDTAWFGGVFAQTTIAAASTAMLVTSLTAGALAIWPFTVIRSRGLVGIVSDQTGTGENYSAAYGRCVVSDQSVAIGVTAVPTPVTDNDSDLWMVMEFVYGRFTFVTGAGILVNHGSVDRTYDSKAARKVDIGQDLIGVVETTGVSSGAIITTFTRALVKLH